MTTKKDAKERWGWEERVLLGGVCLGLLTFVLIGVVPAVVYGGYAALGLLADLSGGPVEPTLGARAFIAVGMILGFVSVGGLFAVLGALPALVVILIAAGVGDLRDRLRGEAAPTKRAPATEGKVVLPGLGRGPMPAPTG